MSALVLVNPLASRVRRDQGLRASIERVAREAGARVEFPRGEAALGSVIEAYLDELGAGGLSVADGRVCLVGGDGSHRLGVTRLHRALRGRPWPRLALVAGGTVNTTARSWGFGGPTASALERALRSRQVALRPSLRLVEGGGDEHVGFIWGAGLVARFFERYNAGEGGVVPAARLALRIAGGALVGSRLARQVLTPSPLRLTVDGEALAAGSYSLAVASVHRSVGLGIRVTYRAGEAPGRVHLVASTASPAQLGRLGPRVLLGAPLGGSTVDALAREIRVEFPGDAASILDGDWVDARALTLSAGPWLPVVR